MSIKTEFAVEMTCNDCVESVTKALRKVDGVSDFNIDLEQQSVIVESTNIPSTVIREAIESTGRTAILRGQGSSIGKNFGSAVSILENDQSVLGVVRFVQISEEECVIEGSLDGLSEGKHGLHVHEFGDLSSGWKSTGDVFSTTVKQQTKRVGALGNISSDSFGKSKFTFTNSDLKVWDIIGRSLVVHAKPDNNNSVCSAESDNIGNGFGIIARSSGLLGNTKKVCACDGRTLWNDKQLGVNKNTASTPTPTTTTQAETTTAALFPKSSQEPSSRNDVISSSTPHPFFFSSI